jgi:hypothetical protein
MALVKYGAIISEARGKESGIIFSRNAYGGYIKQKVSPVNPQTTYQQTQRSQMGSIAQAWRSLDQSERDQWEAFGAQMVRVNRFGDQTSYTGFSAYMLCNRNLTIAGVSTIDTPVAVGTFPELVLGTPTLTTADVSLVFTPTPLTSGFIPVVEATQPILTARRFLKNYYRKIKVGGSGQTSPMALSTEYESKFGALPPVGAYVGLRVRLVESSTGWSSPVYTTGGVVVTP